MAGRTLHLGVLPEFAGYGISALAATVEESERLVRALFLKERDAAAHLKGTEIETMTWEGAKEYFGFEATTSFDAGLKATIDWYIKTKSSTGNSDVSRC